MKTKVVRNILIAIPITTFIVFINITNLVSFNAIIAYLFYMIVISIILYKDSWLYNALLSFIFLVLIMICDYFCLAIIGVFINNDSYLNNLLSLYSSERRYYLFLDKGLLILITILIRYYIKKYISHSEYKILIAIGSTSILLVFITYNFSAAFALLGWSIYVIIICIIALAFIFYKKWKEAEAIQELLQLQSNSIMEYYDTLYIRQEKSEKILHDIRYHYLNMIQLLEDHKYQKCLDYLTGISDVSLDDVFISFSGNKYIDFIINLKKYEAEEKGISVKINSDILGSHICFQQEDINIIFGNLLDNAIEACEKLEIDKRWIELKFIKQKNIIFITIKNSYKNTPKIINGNLITNKNNPKIHGLGLKNVKEKVYKYNSLIDIKFDENIFTVEITMFN